jgi:methylated-DNA-[protein]-cysteine S-methyltransferase
MLETAMEFAMMRYTRVPTPCGPLLLVIDEQGLRHVDFCHSPKPVVIQEQWQQDEAALAPFAEQFAAYFAGHLQRFELPLSAPGTDFQQQVWQALGRIPYGQTRSYADIALDIGNPKSVRAVGAANGRNPLAIIVPCHRVIGRDGSLTGYAGGLAIKQFLLALEQQHRAKRE